MRSIAEALIAYLLLQVTDTPSMRVPRRRVEAKATGEGEDEACV